MVGIEEGDETYATGERQAEIHTLAVLPEERDRGLGGTMHGNDAAQRFYERRGYAPFVHVHYRKLAGE